MQKQNTGLFIKFEKKAMLLRFVRSVLRHDFNFIVDCGPKTAHNTCELILQTISSNISSDFDGAKDLLLKYINVLDCYSAVPSDSARIPQTEPSTINQTVSSRSLKVPTIDLIDDSSDIDLIVLDDSKIDEVQLKDNSEVLDNSGLYFVDKSLSSFETSDPNRKTKKEKKSKLQTDKVKHKKQKNKDVGPGHKKKQRCHDQVENSKCIDITSDEDINISSGSGERNITVSPKLQNLGPNTIDISEYSEDEIVIIEQESIDDSVIVVDSAEQSICPSRKKKLKKKILKKKVKNEPLKKSNICKHKKILKAWSRPAHMSQTLTRNQNVYGTSSLYSVGNNIYNPNVNEQRKEGLRPIIIDGSNVAIGHGKGTFSVRGLQICIEYFLRRGHRHIKIFVPHFRMNSSNYNELNELVNNGFLILTPSRKVDGKVIVPYDDRFIIQYAAEKSGVVVSSDNYRDLYNENPAWKETIESRLLMFTWVDDVLMFPQDPLGRNGPTLDEFLRY